MGGFLVFGEVLDLLVNVFFKNGEFLAAWLTAEGELESVVNKRFEPVGFVAKKTGRETLGDFKKGGIVCDGERLQRGIGTDAVGADGLEVWGVKGGEKRVRALR